MEAVLASDRLRKKLGKEREERRRLEDLAASLRSQHLAALNATEAAHAKLEEEQRQYQAFADEAKKEYEQLAEEVRRWQGEYRRGDARLSEVQSRLNARLMNNNTEQLAMQERRIKELELDVAMAKARVADVSKSIANAQRQKEDAVGVALHAETALKDFADSEKRQQEWQIQALKEKIKEMGNELKAEEREAEKWRKLYVQEQRKRDAGKRHIRELQRGLELQETKQTQQVEHTQKGVAALEAKLHEESKREKVDVNAGMLMLRDKCNHWLGKYKSTKLEKEEAVRLKEEEIAKVAALKEDLKAARSEASSFRLAVGMDVFSRPDSAASSNGGTFTTNLAGASPPLSPIKRSSKQRLLEDIFQMQQSIKDIEATVDELQTDNAHWKHLYEETEKQCRQYQDRLQAQLKDAG